jgi:hypothetical protein
MGQLWHTKTMPKRSSKKDTPKDTNELAAFIVEQGTTEPEESPREKNPHAVALGRLGGLRGGKARAERLTEEERREIARKAARARWGESA